MVPGDRHHKSTAVRNNVSPIAPQQKGVTLAKIVSLGPGTLPHVFEMRLSNKKPRKIHATGEIGAIMTTLLASLSVEMRVGRLYHASFPLKDALHVSFPASNVICPTQMIRMEPSCNHRKISSLVIK
jgi:hypothetical protein